MHDNQRSDRRPRSGSRQRRNRSGRDSSYNSVPTRPQPPVKLSFWQKLVRLFTGNPKSASSSRSSSAPAARDDRSSSSQNGHRRFESSSPAPATPRQTRKPELVEVNSPKIYVGNLSFDAAEGDLFELFNGVGQVQNAEIVSNKYTQKSKGFAFVTMLTVDEARRAVTELHDKDFMGRKLVVSGAKTSDTRESRDNRDSREPRDSRDAAPRQEEPEAHEENVPSEPTAL
jgi:RNA recognition motif-containing protein